MTVRKLAVAALLLTVLAASPAAAYWTWGLTYETIAPMGDLKDFTDKSWSWRGMGVEGRRWLTPSITAGLAASWNVVTNEFTDETWSQPGIDVHGNQRRDVNAVPIFANMHAYFGEPDQWRFFVGLNAGAIYADYRANMGLFSYREDNWHLAIAPEVGVQLPYWYNLGYVAVRWQYGFSAGDIDEISYLTFRFGVGLR